MARSPSSPEAGTLPPSPFFNTPAQRVALARERFFEEGERPSGLVPDLVIQSWTRCVGAGRRPSERPVFDPVTRGRIAGALQRSGALLEAAALDLDQLDAMLAGTHCKAMLTDRHGIIVRATQAGSEDGELLARSCRVGVDLSEAQVGTTAPGVSTRMGNACTVIGAEHFFDSVQVMRCAASPIHDRHGELAGVLDLSVESRAFDFDAASLVRMTATSIENRLLAAQSTDHLVLRFQVQPTLIGTPLEGMAAVAGDGSIAWVNGAGARLLAPQRAVPARHAAEDLFGQPLSSLLGLLGRTGPSAWRLPSGLLLWMHAALQARDGFAGGVGVSRPGVAAAEVRCEPITAPSAGNDALSLEQANRRLIESTLAECGGNVSKAARRLGVSRGLLYRRLQQWRSADPPDGEEGAG
jgi:transcriptional regulator of acetoin/glycerol metabolism